jgi:hypothetical protein
VGRCGKNSNAIRGKKYGKGKRKEGNAREKEVKRER